MLSIFRRRCRHGDGRWTIRLLESRGEAPRWCRRPAPPALLTIAFRPARCRRRRRQADGPLRRPHQRLLAGAVAPELVALAPQRRQRTLRRRSTAQTPWLAGHQHTLEGPILQEII